MAKDAKGESKKQLRVVLANGQAVPAELIKIGLSGHIDLRIIETGQVITSSPPDPTGKLPDSWHEVDASAE